MTSRILLLTLLVFLAAPAFAQDDMPPLEDYQPPPGLFYDGEDQSTNTQDAPSPFLTTVDPVKPKAPEKPVVKKAAIEKKAEQKPVKKKSDKSKNPYRNEVVGLQKPKIAEAPKPIVKSKTQLETGQRLVNPNARDILASIQESQPVAKANKGSFALKFLPGDSVLTLDMKNELLKNYVPSLQGKVQSRVKIQPYGPEEGSGQPQEHALAVARAQETYDFLAAAGVDEARISVLPLKPAAEPALTERVDIISVAPVN